MQHIEHYIHEPSGVHARPASLFAKTANGFQSEITIIANDKKINGKGIIGIMTLGLKQGDKMEIIIQGEDEEIAATALSKILL